MRVKTPGLGDPSLQQTLEGVPRALSFDLQRETTAKIKILPRLDRFGQVKYTLWMGGRVWTFDEGAGQEVDTSVTGLGGIVDGIATQVDTYYLLWAIGDEFNSEFQGWAITRKPLANWTAIVSGGLGSEATLTLAGGGTKNAFQFTTGARVILRSNKGVAPNFEWNHGVITEIASTDMMKVQMESNLLGSTAVTFGSPAEIEQLDRFRPWDGENSETNFRNTYRLAGEFRLDSSKNIFWVRKADENWRTMRVEYAGWVSAAASATRVFDYWRYIPTWSRRLTIGMALVKDATPTSVRVIWLDPDIALPANQITGMIHNGGSTLIGGGTGDVWAGQGSIFLDQQGTPGSNTLIKYLNSVNDGGLRE